MPLREVTRCRQVNHQGLRRWFSDRFFDLIVWYDYAGNLTGFQLCYDKPQRERALTWRRDSGFRHHQLDNSKRAAGRHLASPLLVADGEFPRELVAERFRRSALSLEPKLAAFVQAKLDCYSAYIFVPLREPVSVRR